MIIESLSNEGGNSIENVTQKVSSRRFKLYRSYCNSFNSSNVGVFFSRVEFYKERIYVHKKKKTFLFEFSRFFCFVLEGGGGHLNYFGKKGGHPKNFLMKRGGGSSYSTGSCASNPTSPHYPIKNERSLNLKS